MSQLDTSLSHLVEAHSAYGQVVRTWRGKLKEAKCAVVSRAHSRNQLLAAGFSEAAVDRGAAGARVLGGPIGSDGDDAPLGALLGPVVCGGGARVRRVLC